MLNGNKKLLLVTVAASVALPPIPALAALEEIVVTARKREESILKVPIAETALTGEQLTQFNTHDLYSLTERVPGFVMGTQVGSIGATPTLRGIGTGTLNPTIDQSVSLNIDGLGLSQGLAYTAALFDMKQTEVLRGPQSLFYGKNSTAGVISITTQDPGDEFEMVVSTSYEFEADEKVGELILSGPVTDTLGLRLAAKGSGMKGYFDNKAQGDGVTSVDPKYDRTPNKEDDVVRGTLLWQPSDQFNAKLKANYARTVIHGNGGDGELASCPDGTGAITYPYLAAAYGTASPQFFYPTDNCRLDGTLHIVGMNPDNALYTGVRNDGVPFYDLQQVFGSLQMNYIMPSSLTLSSVTGYYDADHSVLLNGMQTGYAGPSIAADSDFDRDDVTQELRLVSNYDGDLNFMAGMYYQKANMSNRTGLFFFQPLFGSFPKEMLSIDIRTVAFFGQALWQVNPELELSAGARWTDEKRKFDAYDLTNHMPVPRALYGTNKLEAKHLSPELAATYTPTDTLTLFLSYRKAFKSGSWDTVTNPTGTDLSFGDEKVHGFEGGIKTRLLEDTLALNMSLYHYKYEDLQVGANESTSAGFQDRTLNAASATVNGVDFDVTYEPSMLQGLQLFAVVNYNDAKYDKFDNANCWGGQTAAQGCNRELDTTVGSSSYGLYTAQDLSGGDLIRAPEWTSSFGFTYERPVADGKMVVSFGSSTHWSDDYATNTLLREDFYQGAYFKTSANLGLRDAEGAWEVSFIGKNLNNKITAGTCTNFNGQGGNFPGTSITGSPSNTVGVSGVDESVCIPERGKELWLKLTLRPALWF